MFVCFLKASLLKKINKKINSPPLMLRLFLQPQKKERQATPKKTRDVKVEDDEYAGSTDVDEPGLYELTVTGGKKMNWKKLF